MNKIQIKKCYPYNINHRVFYNVMKNIAYPFNPSLPFKDLITIKGLSLWGNCEITDLTPFEHLINLQQISLGGCQLFDKITDNITDIIAPLRKLVNLKVIFIPTKEIKDPLLTKLLKDFSLERDVVILLFP